ncbi:MAG: ABC transporter ATP-binding protein [Ginsengibacter sp.]
MSNVVIKVENLSKQYRLGNVSMGTLSHDLNRWWYGVRGKEDPYLKIGEENDRAKKGMDEYAWALKDINFEVKHGEVLGIIGRNGAGKSTLLKILSRTTSPTTGIVKIKGRVASLLEVGTGFHPELTGRENIFLNGAILGMTKREIKSKFDEIVDFAGVERYIDTPVKRYSSGMYVRLAFGVAAHLEPEILIVDEVLAVGDAEFQKKALGKMKDVSTKEGRTVLFVSHNMTAVNSLCTKCIYLRNGIVIESGETKYILAQYLSSESEMAYEKNWQDSDNAGDDIARIISARLINRNNQCMEIVHIDEEVGVEFFYEVKEEGYQPTPNLHIFNMQGDCVFVSSENSDAKLSEKGCYQTVMWIPPDLLNDGRYIIGLATTTFIPLKIHFFVKEALIFDVIESMDTRQIDFTGKIPGVVRPKLEWQTNKYK